MKPLVSDALWERLQPLLPPPPPRRVRFPGRNPLDCRKILTGILSVLKTGIARDDLPDELGCGCGKLCRHSLRLWYRAGVWVKLHAVLLAELNGADQIDWERALVDDSFAKAPEGGEDTGPDPTDRGKSGSEHHVMTDAKGVPLSATTTAAKVHEVTQVVPILAARNIEHGSGSGVSRWFVERTIAWLHSFGRLRRRLDRNTELQEAFLRLACALICLSFLIQ